MFNRKRIAELEKELTEAKIRNYDLNQEVKRLLVEIRQAIKNINPIQKPASITHYDATAIDLAKQIQKMQKKRSCGFGVCQMAYQVPCGLIDKIVFAADFKKENELPEVDNSTKLDNFD